MGAFGLNASIMDASNLAWKMGLVSQGRASLEKLMATYSHERREHACRIIETSGEYLRFICNASISIANVRDADKLSDMLPSGTSMVAIKDAAELNGSKTTNGTTGTNGTNGHATNDENLPGRDLKFLASFFGRNGKFLLGVDAPFHESVITPPTSQNKSVVKVRNGVRAPNPRVCFSINETGYLYDKLTGAATFHLVLFASTMHSNVRRRVSSFASAVLGNPNSFYHRYGASALFNIVVVLKCLPDETDKLMAGPELDLLKKSSTILYDDRAPDEDAHTTYGASHSSGAVVFVRPDLWVGMSTTPDDVDGLETYFNGFLEEAHVVKG